MEYTDFMPYVLQHIEEIKSQNGDWIAVLTPDYWGEQLLHPTILNDIKECIK